VVALASDGTTILNAARDHLALSRELPVAFDALGPAPSEPEAARLVFSGAVAAPAAILISTRRANGALLDVLANPPLSAWPCPPGIAGSCWATQPLRLTPDRLDRDYPAARERSLQGELGGELSVEVGTTAIGSWRIGAPHSALLSNVERLSAKLRVRVLRIAPGGAPAIGSDVTSAVSIARAEIQSASRLWAQCGIDLQGPSALDVQVVDPPPVQLVALGCDLGLPASGGEITVDVHGQRVRVATRPGDSPVIVAERLARTLRARGFGAKVSPNPRIASGADGAVDVLVRGAQGAPTTVTADPDPNLPLSTDKTLGVCLGEVDLSDGLTHFVETDAAAGTLEERALIKAFDDGDPSTIEILIIPSFDQSGRIGESFIDDEGAAIRNTVIIDRSAVRAGPRSYALAHELGHVLLDMPGHPDDYGVDQSGALMDSDASDASVFGPRRLTLADCERAFRESGPGARAPLLEPWPLPHEPATSAR
jgi:hypothetical protein